MDLRAQMVLSLVLVSCPAVSSATDCFNMGTDGKKHTVEENLEWCSRDHGSNEGAACGAKALSGVDAGALGGIVLSNTWDRTNMMGAAKAAYKAGAKQQAIDAAICCQVHTPDAHECLEHDRAAVGNWLGR